MWCRGLLGGKVVFVLLLCGRGRWTFELEIGGCSTDDCSAPKSGVRRQVTEGEELGRVHGMEGSWTMWAADITACDHVTVTVTVIPS